MKLVTWNVNSLNARAGFVEWYLDSADPDVLCIQELKLDADKVPVEIFESRGYHVAMHAQPQWNGVLIASKEPITDVDTGLPGGDEGQARLVAGTTFGLRVVNLYCPQGQSEDSPKFQYKLGFYRALRTWLAERCDFSAPLAVLGDLNIAPRPEDVWDPAGHANVPSHHPLEHAEWAKLMDLGLHDAVVDHLDKVKYSYWDYRAGCFHKNQGMRIDHILVTPPVLERVQTAWINRDARKKKLGLTASDHAPVGVELS